MTIVFMFCFLTAYLLSDFKSIVHAITSWQESDINQDGVVDMKDVDEVLAYLHCPAYGECGTTLAPTQFMTDSQTFSPEQTELPKDVNFECSVNKIGTMLVMGNTSYSPGELILNIYNKFDVKGLVAAGAPSSDVRDIYFSKLNGWNRQFIAGTLAQLTNKHSAAKTFSMDNMYDCLTYGPESEHNAGSEALTPEPSVIKAKSIAQEAGKCLFYGPAVRDYETPGRITTNATDAEIASVIGRVAPHVEGWMIQLGKYQPMVDRGKDFDGNPYSWKDFDAWINKWVEWIKTANPQVEVWTQLGIGERDVLEGKCLAPEPPEYLVEWTGHLVRAGVDGIFFMPSQTCQPCPANPQPDFICSDDSRDNYYYEQSLKTIESAIGLMCD